MQPADQFELLAQKCAAHVASLGEEFASAPELRGVDLGAMGEALQRVAPAAAAETHPCDEPYPYPYPIILPLPLP